MLAVVAVAAAALDPFPAPVSGMARASDGDSFRLGEDRVRLLGLDAPELAQNCTDASGRSWPCGRAARDRMAGLLARNPVDCRPEGRDQYDRLLARCTVGDRDLGAILVAEGLAISSGAYGGEQAEAQRQKRGIWAGGFDSPRSWRDDRARPQGWRGWLSGFGL